MEFGAVKLQRNDWALVPWLTMLIGMAGVLIYQVIEACGFMR
jgi:hypothetical protein